MRKFLLIPLILLIMPLSNALSYCDYDLMPQLTVTTNNTTFTLNLTFISNGTYQTNVENTTVLLKLSCNQFFEVEPKNLKIVFENETQKQFYLVVVPNFPTELDIYCIDCEEFNITEYENLSIDSPKAINFNITQKAKAGNYTLHLIFASDLFILNYPLSVEVKPIKEISLSCPEETTQFYNYPLYLTCEISNNGNVEVPITIKYLDKSETLRLQAFQTKKFEIFREMELDQQLELKQLNVTLSYDNKTINRLINITWKDASKPKILAIDYDKAVYYGQTQNIIVKAYDDTKIEKVYAVVDNQTLLLSQVPNGYLLAYQFKELGTKQINITACDSSSCTTQQISINVQKIPIEYEPQIILPMIKKGKTYELTLLKSPQTIEFAKANISAPDFVNFNIFPLTNFKEIKATLISNNITGTTSIKINLTLPNYTTPENVSITITFATGQEEISLPKGLQVMGSNITCRLENPNDPFSNRICEIVYPSFTSQNFIPIPVNLIQEYQMQQEELSKLRGQEPLYKIAIVMLAIISLILFLLYLKETEFFEKIRT